MSVDLSVFLTYVGAVLLIFIFGRLLLAPLKLILRLVLSSLAGGLFIFLFNLAGENFGLMIPLNEFSAVITGLVGLPGAALLLLFAVK